MRHHGVIAIIAPVVAAWATGPLAAQVSWRTSETPQFGSIHRAAARGDMAALRAELASGTSAEAMTSGSGTFGGLTPLIVALCAEQPEVVEALLKAGADPNTPTHRGWTPVMAAANVGNAAMVRVLHRAGADVNAIHPEDATEPGVPGGTFSALEIAIYGALNGRKGSAQVLETLVELGATLRPGTRVTVEQDVLFRASRSDTLALECLLRAGADVRVRDKDGRTPLFEALPRHVALLVNAGADIEAVDRLGRTPLFHAAHSGDAERVRALLKAGADPLRRNSGAGSALHEVVFDLRRRDPLQALETVRVLVEAGIPLNRKDWCAQTPLCLAAQGGATSVFDFMIESGADPHHVARYDPVRYVNAKDWTVLMFAATSGQGDLVRRLVHLGNDVNARGKDNWTPLGLACRARGVGAVQALIEAGADLEARHDVVIWPVQLAGMTPLMIASFVGDAETVRALLHAGAKPGARNEVGESALTFAALTGGVETVEALLAAGASPHCTGLEERSLIETMQDEVWSGYAHRMIDPQVKKRIAAMLVDAVARGAK